MVVKFLLLESLSQDAVGWAEDTIIILSYQEHFDLIIVY